MRIDFDINGTESEILGFIMEYDDRHHETQARTNTIKDK